jgi:hypothetical protein
MEQYKRIEVVDSLRRVHTPEQAPGFFINQQAAGKSFTVTAPSGSPYTFT